MGFLRYANQHNFMCINPFASGNLTSSQNLSERFRKLALYARDVSIKDLFHSEHVAQNKYSYVGTITTVKAI